MKMLLEPGAKLPSVPLAALRSDQSIETVTTDVFRRKRIIIVGIPAPFSPVCSRVHIPPFVEKAPNLLNSGFDMIVCLSAADPWVLSAWSKTIDPEHRLRYFSDGNLAFTETCCLTCNAPDLFLAHRMRRFSLVAADLVVERVGIETAPLEVTCSAAAELL